jgi:hypothetical protein
MESAKREATILELSTSLHDVRLQARHLTEDVPKMFAVVQALQHADAMLDMVWELHECTSHKNSILDLEWESGVGDRSPGGA